MIGPSPSSQLIALTDTDRTSEPAATSAALRRGATDRQLLALVICTLFAVVLARTAWVADSAYLTFRTIDNFVNGYGLRWNVAERVQVFTHPLWLALLTPFYAVTREAYFTALALSSALAITTVYLLVTRVAIDPGSAIGAAAALVLSRSFADFSTSGLETPLTCCLLATFWVGDTAWSEGRLNASWLAGAAALVALTDLSAVAFVVPAVSIAIWRERSRRGVSTALSFFLGPVLAWEVFSFVYYGALLPNPTYARLYAHVPSGLLVRHGLVYLFDSLNLDPLSLTAIGAACGFAFAGTARRTKPVAVGIVLYLILIVWTGGDAMSGRLLAPALVSAAVIIGRVDVAPLALVTRLQLFAAVVGLGLLAPRGIGFVRRLPDNPTRYISELTGIADQRHLSYISSGLLNARRDVPWPQEEGVAGGRTPREERTRVAVSLTPGLQGFFAGPALHLIDPSGVTDPLLARLPASSPWTIGIPRRAIPDGYEGVAGDPAGRYLSDPDIGRLSSLVVTATRDPIWSRRRFQRILRLNFTADPREGRQ